MSPLFTFFGKKNKDDLSNLSSKRTFLGKQSDLNSFNLNNVGILTSEDLTSLNLPSLKKILEQAKLAKRNGNKTPVITIGKFGSKERELFRNKLKKRKSTRRICKLKNFDSHDSLPVLRNKKSCELRRAKMLSMASIVESTSSSTTLRLNKNKNKLMVKQSTHKNILMNSVPLEIIKRNTDKPEFIQPVRRACKINRDLTSPDEHNSIIKPEVIMELEAKTKAIPGIMKRITSIENELSDISKTTREIKEVVSSQNVIKDFCAKSYQLSDSSILDGPRTRKTKNPASKKKKFVKGKRQQTRAKYTPGPFSTAITSEPCKNLNFVFEPKSIEFSSNCVSASKQLNTHVPYPSSSTGGLNLTPVPKPDEKIVVSQSDYKGSENPLDNLLKSVAFASILGGKMIAPFFPNTFPLICTAGEHNSAGERQNQLTSVGNPATTECTSVIERDQVKEDDALKEEYFNDVFRSMPFPPESSQEYLVSHVPVINENKRDNITKRSIDESLKPETKLGSVHKAKESPEPREIYEDAEENIFETSGAREKDEEEFGLYTTTHENDFNFENSAPTLIESPPEDCRLMGDYMSVAGRSKVQPCNARSILSSFGGFYSEYEQEEFRLPTTDKVDAKQIFEFDFAGDGDVPNAMTEENLRNLEIEKLNFFEVEKEFAFEGCSGYLDRESRKRHDKEIRSIILCANMTLPYNINNFANFVTCDMAGDSIRERKTLTDYNFDCKNIYKDSESTTPICDLYENTPVSYSHADNRKIGDMQKMVLHPGFCKVVEDLYEHDKCDVDLTVRGERFGHKLLEDIEEALEECGEEQDEGLIEEENLTETVEIPTDCPSSRTVELDLSSLSSLVVKNVNKLYVEGIQIEEKKVDAASQTDKDTLSIGCQVEEDKLCAGNQAEDFVTRVGCETIEIKTNCDLESSQTPKTPLIDPNKLDDDKFIKHYCYHFCFSAANEILCSDVDKERDFELICD